MRRCINGKRPNSDSPSVLRKDFKEKDWQSDILGAIEDINHTRRSVAMAPGQSGGGRRRHGAGW